MTFDWTTKEKIVLLSDILEYGDQVESWSTISNDLSRTFPTNTILSQSKRDGRYSIKNCKQQYQHLVERYKSQWTENDSSNGLKIPLAKYIWIQLKSIYQAELTYQLNESRKKLTEFWLEVTTAINIKSNNTVEPTPPLLTTEITTPVTITQENEPQEDKPSTIEIISQVPKIEPDIPQNEPIQSTSPSEEIHPAPVIFDNPKEESPTITDIIADQPQIKEEPHIEIPTDIILNDTNQQPASSISPDAKQNLSLIEQDISQPLPMDCSSPNILSDQQSSTSQSAIISVPLQNPLIQPDSASSSRSTSRTSSETKTDVIKIIPTTTPKYHVYFSPKNSINNNNVNNPPAPLTTTTTTTPINKPKPKRKITDDIKDENENESISQQDPLSLSTEQSKLVSSTAPITRRSINTRSVPNTAAEQEEEKSRRFSAMLSENPNSWQSQSMAIIQFILAHKQGYLFEQEITDEIAPKYHQFVRRPIALDTIRKTLESNGYQSKDYFKRDVYLMLYNAMKYNPRYHHVHRSAKQIFNLAVPLFYLSAQDIHGQITTRNSLSLPTTTATTTNTTTNDMSSVKRKRIKV
ncbi:unnamed protein product [Adineta steineri]|uniref:Bromodomain-containing protein n=1 Tax=Adineta steineri TaxID=433720 RepID=A0A813U5A2_9BILA|nr:unnamed protein product [Adineta steineri]CAF1074257.1 unnamed protein product [Adineta steineri]CAF1074977.1 unnamed protein product [Adineta steineri]